MCPRTGRPTGAAFTASLFAESAGILSAQSLGKISRQVKQGLFTGKARPCRRFPFHRTENGWHPIGDVNERRLKIISIDDGEAHELCRFVNASNAGDFPRWSRDGRYIFFSGIRPGDKTWDVWYVPVGGGEPKGLGLSMHRIQQVSPHPDGSRLAFYSLGPTVHGPEVWVMSNFLAQ